MKKLVFTLIVALMALPLFAGNILVEGFEYANHDLESPIGWNCDDNAWRCGYLEKDGNRLPHSGNWYAFSDANDAWMFMPLYMFTEMRYRFTLWAISDGEVQLEIWAGSDANPESMHTQFSSTTISSGQYEKVSVFVETIPANCQYFAFRAVSSERGNYLTIDDIEIDMVEQYDFASEPVTGDTAMYPGSRATFHYLVINKGYDPVSVSMHPSNEYFYDFVCTANGVTGMTVPTQAGETVEVTMEATMRPEIVPGTVTWLDISMTIPCNCNTSLVTFWVTPLDITQTSENDALQLSVFPNPAADFLNVEGEAVLSADIYDLNGRRVMTLPAATNRIRISELNRGHYLLSVMTEKGRFTQSFVKE